MLLAEDLLLLVTNDATGRLSVPAAQADAGLGGANLLELTLLGKVDVSGPQDQGRSGRLVIRDPSPAGDEILDGALRVLTEQQGKTPSAVIRPLGKNLRPALYQRLADGGVLRAEKHRVLGLFPIRAWAAQDPGHEAGIRQQVAQALVQPGAPDQRTAALIALLHALKCEHKVIDPRTLGLSRRQLRDRAAEISAGNWASDAIRKAIDAMVAATAAASAAAVAASSG
jgi:Golgi phosphoprotein 3 (GPP34)